MLVHVNSIIRAIFFFSSFSFGRASSDIPREELRCCTWWYISTTLYSHNTRIVLAQCAMHTWYNASQVIRVMNGLLKWALTALELEPRGHDSLRHSVYTLFFSQFYSGSNSHDVHSYGFWTNASSFCSCVYYFQILLYFSKISCFFLNKHREISFTMNTFNNIILSQNLQICQVL